MAKKLKLYVCTKGKACKKRGGKKVFDKLEEAIRDFDLEKNVCVKKTSCLGKCGKGPAIELQPLDRIYGSVFPETCEDFVRALKKKGKPPKKLRIG
jgi:bidirectional [NiFe] hydrogenase diaphorase subunit